ncbi:MAG TPA: class I SAM-dependent methyltransferase [Limnobacter sp.]|uniref:class I SAM-dependent methyltransferase n=1 Tax=Limnobacter sp. TaxID=2003368 RepID=UPI002E3731F4|nr:class I SAM-dependent methyltransferase [Limnobacter sp.]HEX5485987.1 class I SAM-dependent methyltransferase [Limnobacter sp.]
MNPSPWVVRCVNEWLAGRHARQFHALDLACGSGRHASYLSNQGFQVDAVDIRAPELSALPADVRFEEMDLEAEGPWPLAGRQYDVVVVTNYLHRPRFPDLLKLLKPSGALLVYETFMDGNARFGSPRSPAFLLNSAELPELVKPLNLVRFEQGIRSVESPAMIQRAMAISGIWSEIQSQAIPLNEKGNT